MSVLEYSLSHPYPHPKVFTILTILGIVLVLPTLVAINIVTLGYELVPVLRPSFTPNDTVPAWLRPAYLPKFLHRGPPPCQPRDFGRGDKIRLTPSLFEYTVLSAWRNSTILNLANEARITYTGSSFKDCFPDVARFEYNYLEQTQTITTGIVCQSNEINASLETSATFAVEFTKDIVGRYYRLDANVQDFIEAGSRDYRVPVFQVLDVISTDLFGIIAGQRLSDLALGISAVLNLTSGNIKSVSATYSNGTSVLEKPEGTSFGSVSIYGDSIHNMVGAVTNAIELDLGHAGPNNIFLNPLAVNDTFSPNLPPPEIGSSGWVRNSQSFWSGSLDTPYVSWAQALRLGHPPSIKLGNPTGLPTDYQIATNYLCPSYRAKPVGSFLASVFVGTATMSLSVWGAWLFGTAMVAQRISEPCFRCAFERNNEKSKRCWICEKKSIYQLAGGTAPTGLEDLEEGAEVLNKVLRTR